ncbi:hypothetical protein GGI35DRAFT_409174 [Trichoderma velutinum]
MLIVKPRVMLAGFYIWCRCIHSTLCTESIRDIMLLSFQVSLQPCSFLDNQTNPHAPEVLSFFPIFMLLTC